MQNVEFEIISTSGIMKKDSFILLKGLQKYNISGTIFNRHGSFDRMKDQRFIRKQPESAASVARRRA